MAFDWHDIENMDETDLRAVIDRAQELLDEKLGYCPDCHGSGRFLGDKDFECDGCEGDGKLETYRAITDSGKDEEAA